MRRFLLVITAAVALSAFVLTSSLRLESGVALAELARSSTRIVLGKVERVERLERPLDPKLKYMTAAEERWKDVPSVALAEFQIEQTFKGRTGAKSVWFYASVRSGDDTRELAQGERLLLFFGEPLLLA